jgi:hypothetical protein
LKDSILFIVNLSKPPGRMPRVPKLPNLSVREDLDLDFVLEGVTFEAALSRGPKRWQDRIQFRPSDITARNGDSFSGARFEKPHTLIVAPELNPVSIFPYLLRWKL